MSCSPCFVPRQFAILRSVLKTRFLWGRIKCWKAARHVASAVVSSIMLTVFRDDAQQASENGKRKATGYITAAVTRLGLTLCLWLFAGSSHALWPPVVEWEKTYGSTTNEGAKSVQQTADGGYVVAGWVQVGRDNLDFYLLKTDARGNLEWEKTFGGLGDDHAESVQQTADGGYIAAGWTKPNGGSSDVYVIKTDANGDKQWERTYGGAREDLGHSIKQTPDGGYIVAGETNSYGRNNVYLLKTDPVGDIVWERNYGDPAVDSNTGYSVDLTSDGGYIVGGKINPYPENDDCYFVKTNAAGDLLWEKAHGGSDNDLVYSVQQTLDGGYIAAGFTQSFGSGSFDAYILKINANGEKQWDRTFGTEYYDVFYSCLQTRDGDYIAAGYGSSPDIAPRYVRIVKLDTHGYRKWELIVKGAEYREAHSVIQTSDGGYMVAGQKDNDLPWRNDVYLIKLAKPAAVPYRRWHLYR